MNANHAAADGPARQCLNRFMNRLITPKLSKAGCLYLSVLLLTPAWAVERQSLSGHVPAVTARLQPVGRLPGSSRLNLAIGLPLRNQEALTALLEQIYDPASPQYRHYLAPEQFVEQFGPPKEDYDALIAFATAQGLVITAIHPNRVLLDVTGSAEDIEKAFHVNMQVYQHPTEDRTFHAPDVEPSLDLAVRVLHIGGFEDLNVPRPRAHRKRHTQSDGSKPLSGSGPGGGFLGNDFRAAYAPGVSLTGAGQSLGLLEFDDYFPTDITDYEKLAKLPNVPLQNVPLDGFSGPPGSWNSEVALDTFQSLRATQAQLIDPVLAPTMSGAASPVLRAPKPGSIRCGSCRFAHLASERTSTDRSVLASDAVRREVRALSRAQ